MNDIQTASIAVSTMIDDAKGILKRAKTLADEHGIYFSLHDLYEEVTEEWVDWNSSSC
jgi:hypothetical protein